MLKLNLTSAKSLANTRTSKHIAFPGLVVESRKAGFSIPPVLGSKLGLKDADSVVIIGFDDVVDGAKVTRYFLAKGKKYEHVYGADGQPLRQEGINKFQYKEDTGVGTIVRLSDSNLLKASNGGAWNHLNGSEGKVVRYNVSDVMEVELNTEYKAEGSPETFNTVAVEILLETKSVSDGVIRPKGGSAKPKTTSTATAAIETEVDEAYDDEEEGEDEAWEENE